MNRFRFQLAASISWFVSGLCVLFWSGAMQAQETRSNNAPTQKIVVPSGDHIVAIVNAEPITNSELQAAVDQLQKQSQKNGFPLAPRSELLQRTLERMINERAMVSFAKSTGVRIDDALLNASLENIAHQSATDLQGLRAQVTEEGVDWNRYRNDVRNELALQRLRERDLERTVQVSDSEVEQFLKNRAASMGLSGREINLAQILIAVPESSTAEQIQARQNQAQEIYQKTLAGEDFAQLAQSHSDSTDRRQGGVMGLRSEARYPELFVQAVGSLQVGQVAPPVQSAAGFHILRLLERKNIDIYSEKVTQTHARHVLLHPDGKVSQTQVFEKILDIRRRAVAGEDFADLARNYSQDGTARQGGDLGWTNPGMFVPEFEKVMDGLKPMQVSEPVVSRFGLHLIQVIERRSATLKPEELRNMAKAQLREQKMEEAYARWVQEIRGNAYVEYRDPPT